MMPDDLDSRLRQAFSQTSSAWQPAAPAVTDLVDGVHRRRARRRRVLTAAGCAVAALVVAAGAYSTTSRPAGRQVTAQAPSPTTTGKVSAGANRAASAEPVPGSAASGSLATPSCAVDVTVGSGPSRCAGVLSTTSSASATASSNGASAEFGAADAPETTVSAEVGQHVSVVPAPTPAGSWSTPVEVPISTLPVTLRRQIAAGEGAARGSLIRLATPVGAGGTPSPVTVFDATKSGVVVVGATLTSPCRPPSSAPTTDGSRACDGSRSVWTLVIVIVSH
ncbi:MAG: hypothetical protein ACLQOZ_07350 [Acidimicrobiales bacterium]